MRSRPENNGFTLIEISMVILIIGILSATIMIGRDLIYTARMRMQISQIGELARAVNAFKLKYNCIPGDCAQAVEAGLGTDPLNDNGNGNNLIGPYSRPGQKGFLFVEVQNFWVHLSRANLIGGNYERGNLPGVNSPPLKFPGSSFNERDPQYVNTAGGMAVASNIQYQCNYAFNCEDGLIFKHAFFPVVDYAIASNKDGQATIGVYNGRDSYALDSKIDDGLPQKGVVRAASYALWSVVTTSDEPMVSFVPFYTNPTVTSPTITQGPDSCIDNSGPRDPQYNIKSTSNSRWAMCSPIIKADF